VRALQRHHGARLTSALCVVVAVLLLAACGDGTRPYNSLAAQTDRYEQGGATHTQAACLAKAIQRVTIPSGAKYVVPGQDVQAAMDRCHVPAKTWRKISLWAQAKFLASTTTSSPKGG
jgi:hypothetical protein